MDPRADFVTTLTTAFSRGFFNAFRASLLGPEAGAPASAPAARARRTRQAKVPAAPPPPPAPPSKRQGFQRVHYRQGRGTFEAKILRFDSASKRVELERLSDGKRLWRPANKVFSGKK
jgi:hypothetical protein